MVCIGRALLSIHSKTADAQRAHAAVSMMMHDAASVGRTPTPGAMETPPFIRGRALRVTGGGCVLPG